MRGGSIMSIPVIGMIIWLFLYPPFIIFIARYTCMIYDTAEGTGLPESAVVL